MSFCAPFPGTSVITASFIGVSSFVGAPSSGQTSATHSLAFTFDAANANRWLLAAVIFTGAGTGQSPARTLDVTIGGITATQLFLLSVNTSQIGFYAAKVPTNVNQTVGLTFHAPAFADANQTACFLYDISGVGVSLNATNPPGFLSAASNTGFISGSGSVPAASAVIGVALGEDATLPTHTWTSITKDADSGVDAHWSYSAAHQNFNQAQAITVTDTLSVTTNSILFDSFLVISP